MYFIEHKYLQLKILFNYDIQTRECLYFAPGPYTCNSDEQYVSCTFTKKNIVEE